MYWTSFLKVKSDILTQEFQEYHQLGQTDCFSSFKLFPVLEILYHSCYKDKSKYYWPNVNCPIKVFPLFTRKQNSVNSVVNEWFSFLGLTANFFGNSLSDFYAKSVVILGIPLRLWTEGTNGFCYYLLGLKFISDHFSWIFSVRFPKLSRKNL